MGGPNGGRMMADRRTKCGIEWEASSGALNIAYDGKTIFSGTVHVLGEGATAEVEWRETSRPVERVNLLSLGHGPEYSKDPPSGLMAKSVHVSISAPGSRVAVKGRVFCAADAIACLPDGGPEIVRSGVANTHNALNRGVFDRDGDWALWSPEPAVCSVMPDGSGSDSTEFTFEASGEGVELVFDEAFYRLHRGFVHWNPAKKLWREPVCGWCSWAAHFLNVTESDMLRAADFVSENLLDYGYDIVQIDDGFQRYNSSQPAPLGPGEKLADLWLNPNDKFPHGMDWLAQEIASRDMTPGMWLNLSLPLGMPEDWYLADTDGKPFDGPYAHYQVNGLVDGAVETAFGEIIHGFKEQGWDYFKLDTIRHILYDAYRRVPEYWTGRGEDSDLAYRAVIQGMRDAAGAESYVLGCWGVIPEIAGIVDGCRIGGDVQPDWGSARMAAKCASQFNYLNNVIWLNDPDYMCFRLPLEQCRSWASMVALTGMQLMVSDAPETYDEPRLDVLRKVAPPLFVHPTTLRPVAHDTELWALDLPGPEKPYTVLGRIAWAGELPAREVAFAEIGLESGSKYLVYDFWNEEFVGEFEGGFAAPQLAEGDCRVYAIRPSLGRPQVLSTTRHIGQGAYELRDVRWEDNTLSGEMKLPADRPFSVIIYVPDGFQARCEQTGATVRLTLADPCGGWVLWSVRFD